MSKSWYQETTLASGLRVLAAPTDSPSVTVIFMAKTGSRNEAPGQAGISHFLEHFVFKGTQKFASTRAVMRALDSVGAKHNAATGKEFTYYWVKSSTEHLERAIELIGEIVFRPRLPEPLLAKEKGTVLQEIAMYRDHPMLKVADRFEKLIFGQGTPLGREIIGTPKTVRSLTRQQLVDYRQSQYRTDTTIFAVAGGVKSAEVIKLATKHFDKLPDPTASHKRPGLSCVKLDSKTRLVDYKKTDQVHLAMGVPALKRLDPRRYVLAVLSTILGGNASSQLFEEIREKRGLAYYVSSVTAGYLDAGYLAIRAGVPPQKAAEVEKLIRHHLSSFNFTGEELSEAKEYLKGQLSLEWEDSQNIAGHLAEESLFEPRIHSREAISAHIDKVTAGQVRRLAKELFADHRQVRVAAIGPVNASLQTLKV